MAGFESSSIQRQLVQCEHSSVCYSS